MTPPKKRQSDTHQRGKEIKIHIGRELDWHCRKLAQIPNPSSYVQEAVKEKLQRNKPDEMVAVALSDRQAQVRKDMAMLSHEHEMLSAKIRALGFDPEALRDGILVKVRR